MTALVFDNVRLSARTQIDLPLLNATAESKYLLKDIQGLDPVEVDVNISDKAVEGGFYQGRRPQNRQIILRVGLNPDYKNNMTSSQLRDELYGLLSTSGPRENLNFVLRNGGSYVVTVEGWVSKFEALIFSKEPEVLLTIDTASPYLSAYTQLDISPDVPKYSIPYNNPGSAVSGFTLSVTVATACNYFDLNDFYGGYLSLSKASSGGWLPGDRITVNTIPGQRDVFYNRGGTLHGAFDLLSLGNQDAWPMIRPGSSSINTPYYASFNKPTIRFSPMYWGI